MNVSLQSQNFLTITDFFRTLQASLYARYGSDRISFTAAYPAITNEDIRTPLITYYFRQEPSQFGSVKEIKPRHGEDVVVDLPEGGTGTVSLYRQRFDYFVTFEIWERDGVTADDLAQEFRRYLVGLTQYFKRLGLADLIFLGMNGEQNERRWRTDLVCRQLNFQLAMDEISNVTWPNMLAFSIQGFVYRSSYHLIEWDSQSAVTTLLEAPTQTLTAAFTPNAADADEGSSDAVVIQLN